MRNVQRYFLDTEFIEDGKTIDLISIGVVCDDGREFYAEVQNDEVPWERANEFVLDHVVPYLDNNDDALFRVEIRNKLYEFVCDGGPAPEFWAYYASYDWICVCQLFGCMVDLPDSWPMMCMDIKQRSLETGVKVPVQQGVKHNALADARWNKIALDHIEKRSGVR